MGRVKVIGPPLDAISRVARPYPAHLLADCDTGLVLFAAAFMGHNDAIHFARRDLETTCVDVDGAKLEEMRGLYPDSWTFVEADAWEFARRSRKKWDAVSADTFSGDAMQRSLSDLELWCSRARRVVTATTTLDGAEEHLIPDGWRSSVYPRSGRFAWLVLTRSGNSV